MSAFIKKLFSITNKGENKIIQLLGVKIEFTNYKKKFDNLTKKFNKLTEKNKRYLEIIKTQPDIYEIYIKNPQIEERDKKYAPIVRKKIDKLLNTNPYPLFYTIEIETINKCNGECQFCPVNKFDDPRQLAIMDTELFYTIIAQLKELNFKGRVQLFSNNEPLLDKRIFDFAKHTKEELNKCHLVFYTNGTLLDIDKFKKLILYCDTFCIDIYYDKEEKKPNNIKPVIKYCLQTPDLQHKVKIQLINKAAIRNSRGGKSKNRKNIYTVQTPCLLPFVQVVVRPTGEISLCCNDATGVFTLGDLKQEKLIDIWNGHYFNEIRKKLRFNREQIPMCHQCDGFGGIIGTNSSSEYVFTPDELKKSWDYIKHNYSQIIE